MHAGVWWDAIAIDGPLGAAVAEELRTGPDGCGPVAVAHRGAVPRWYFLTPAGAASGWSEPGTQLLDDGCHIGLPGSLTSTVHTVRWEVPPRMCPDPPLTPPVLLRAALAAVRAGHER